MTPIAPHIEAFLRENLSRHRGASQPPQQKILDRHAHAVAAA
jgi:hypothetical protein